jgi:hypothetical protein
MTRIRIAASLSFVSVVIHANGKKLPLQRVLLDTGAARTTFRALDMAKLGLAIQNGDQVVYMRGIGGTQGFVPKAVDALEVGDLVASPFTIQLGELDYGIPMNGILGLDFLLQTGAVIDLNALDIRKG